MVTVGVFKCSSAPSLTGCLVLRAHNVLECKQQIGTERTFQEQQNIEWVMHAHLILQLKQNTAIIVLDAN